MKLRLLASAAALAIGLAACSSDSADEPAAADENAPAETSDSEATLVATSDSSLGDILVDANGLTLYGFTNDVDGVPSCFEACADAWPPAFVDSGDLPGGLDSAVFSVADRGDGTFQLSAGVWPLYNFAGDAAAGDVNGQGSGDAWFAAAPDGSLVGAGGEEAAADSTDAAVVQTENGDDYSPGYGS